MHPSTSLPFSPTKRATRIAIDEPPLSCFPEVDVVASTPLALTHFSRVHMHVSGLIIANSTRKKGAFGTSKMSKPRLNIQCLNVH